MDVIKFILILILVFLSGCKASNLVKYEYLDKDGNVYVEYIDPEVLKQYKEKSK